MNVLHLPKQGAFDKTNTKSIIKLLKDLRLTKEWDPTTLLKRHTFARRKPHEKSEFFSFFILQFR